MKIKRFGFLAQLLCKHKNVWKFEPADSYHVNLSDGKSELSHGLIIYCCMQCGRMIARDYAE